MLKTVLLSTRPQFLLLSLSVVLLGSAIALYQGASWSLSLFSLILLGAVLSHAAVNLLNEYQDFQSGLDMVTQKTPFSGGSGALPSHPEAAPAVYKAFVLSMVLLTGLGSYFIWLKGWALLPLGGIGLLVIVSYTSKITRLPWVCLIAPGLAFGPLMVLGTYYVWTEHFSELALFLSLIPFFLVNNLLLLNQVPDLEADQTVGRFNILMKLGVEKGLLLFLLFTFLAFLSLLLSMIVFDLSYWVGLGLLTLLLAIPMLNIVLNSRENSMENIDKLLPALGMNVIINLLTPSLIALGLVLSL